MSRSKPAAVPPIEAVLFPESMSLASAHTEIEVMLESIQAVAQRLQVAADTLGDLGLKPDLKVSLVFRDRIDFYRSIDLIFKL